AANRDLSGLIAQAGMQGFFVGLDVALFLPDTALITKGPFGTQLITCHKISSDVQRINHKIGCPTKRIV
uniref:hypothetical protein n=1 Tax=Sulfitobacter sp. TaxID=1903071 RepID=UPI0035626622